MTDSARELLNAEVDTDLMSAVRDLAQSENREVETLISEALSDLIQKRKHGRPRDHVMAAYEESLDKYDGLYKKLAQ